MFALSTPARLYGLALHRWQESNLQSTVLETVAYANMLHPFKDLTTIVRLRHARKLIRETPHGSKKHPASNRSGADWRAAVHQRCLYLSDMLSVVAPLTAIRLNR